MSYESNNDISIEPTTVFYICMYVCGELRGTYLYKASSKATLKNILCYNGSTSAHIPLRKLECLTL